MSFPAIGFGSGVLGFRPYWRPSSFQTCCFPFALSAIGFQSCFFFTVSPPTRSTLHLLPFLDEFLGLGLNLIPDVVVPMKQKTRSKFLPWPGYTSGLCI